MPFCQPGRLAASTCVPLPLSAPPSPLRLNQPETENLPVSSSVVEAVVVPMATLTAIALPVPLFADLRMPPPTMPAPASALTQVVLPIATAGPPATAFSTDEPPWMTTA